MPIQSAIEKGNNVYVYNEKGHVTAIIAIGNGARDGLIGYTPSSVSLRRGGNVYVYNERGTTIRILPAK
jgi:DNA-binding beta-propeller fold protein YncE